VSAATRRRTGGAGEREPGAPSGRLHNCGCRPAEVFKTATVGTHKLLDLRFAIATYAGSPDCDLDGYWWPERSGRLPEGLIAAATRAALQSLAPGDHTPSAGDDAVPLLALLRDRLRGRGTLRGLAGVARERQAEPSRSGALHLQPLAAALTLVAYACYAPPLLLWTRTPSLRWFRSDVVLEFQRFSSQPETQQ
jgi:hypothetical protein